MKGAGSGHDGDGIEQGAENVLLLARTGLIFAVVRRHHGQDTQVILCNFVSFSRDAGRAPFQISIAWQKEQLDIVTDGVCL